MKIFGKNFLLIILFFSIFQTKNINSSYYKNNKDSSVIKDQINLSSKIIKEKNTQLFTMEKFIILKK